MAFDFDDVRKVTADLSNAGPEIKRRGSQALRKTLLDTKRSAQNRAPVDTGKLKGSIGITLLGGISGEVGPTANYGYWVEMGTSRMAPQPYMGPAPDQHTPAFEQAMQQLGLEGLNG